MERRQFVAQAARAAALGAALGQGWLGPDRVAAAPADTTGKRDLVIMQAADLHALDPHASTLTSDVRVSFNVFDTLVRRHPDGALHPALATEWRRTAPTTWELALRRDVRWHDGSRFTSADAKYSLDRTFDARLKAARLRPWFQTIERTEAPDAGTLVIHTKRPDPLIPARLAGYGGQIVPWSYIDRVGFTAFNQRPVGTGPLRLASWSPGDRCVLAANPDYWGGRLDLDRVILRPVPRAEDRLEALVRGSADLITELPPEHHETVAARASTRAVGALYAGLYVLLVHTWVAPLQRPLVRPALSLAIDREWIVKTLWRGRGVVPSGPIPRGDDHHDPSLPPLRYDPSGARDRLRSAGYAGEPIYVETTSGYLVNDKAMAEAIAAMWEDVGLKVVVEILDTATRHRKNRQLAFKGVSWSNPTSTIRDPDGMMLRLLSPDQPHDYWRHPEFDRLAQAARFAADDAGRAEAYRRMTAIFLEEHPWIVVLQPCEDYGLRRYVEFTPTPDQQLELRRFNYRLRRS
jgi:peptide/nickel transport system substrate-binding protein